MRTVLFSGPFIPEINVGYNVQANGVSINFLKDPFCFRDKTMEIVNSKRSERGPSEGALPNGENEEAVNPVITVEATELQGYVYEGGRTIGEAAPYEDGLAYENDLAHEDDLAYEDGLTYENGLTYAGGLPRNSARFPHDESANKPGEVKNAPLHDDKMKYTLKSAERERLFEMPKLDIKKKYTVQTN
ncbi:conserved Plasmodium protein, unknown function [Plasmodium vivax]|uniref:Uncharacterized protein n=5 Tax=Plasmodium vivax TaxID=5855 RepID=A5K5W7_PLAVS|nr:hypothetical protein, conserved [Plasmodium vivax]KMZ81891.1 hypothetical protein PVIIG_02940 [Plasmodium vivax India VII]KMZ88177.1 hypothetical protein PVBG_02638 [Plasmodium vivax Brazil I]KNA01092.1 hypothetical protein PVNG_02545 [Plasmodium vivax North Korean]EDL45302.1 hypothetical protein, conserved [Plasmodium vivax]CAG9479881.1 unnamed protein product [Plasmodium vivax]|eukprot:XP_001615029.1 hypothetical protein [Plasmodium vivax Sal-1]